MKRLVSINDTCRILAIGKTTTYKLINEGKLLTVKIGRRTLIVVDSIDNIMAEAA